MSWYDKLEGLVKAHLNIDLRKLININISVHITNNSAAPAAHIDNEHKALNINIDKLNPQETRILREALQCAVQEDDQILLEKKSEELIEDFKAAESSDRQKIILDRLREFVPRDDFQAIRASLYLREHFVNEKDVSDLKDDIVQKFGARGAKIANLCSAGYFENMIIPTLDEMRKDAGFSQTIFKKFYDIIVEESGFAVFVQSRMSEEQVSEAIYVKMKSSIAYGLKHIHIHGIGKANIEKIRRTVNNLMAEYPKIEKTLESKVANTIHIRLEFVPDSLEKSR